MHYLLCNSGDLSCPEVRDEYSLTWPAIIADSSVTISCLSGTGKFLSDYK